ncbi:hypothetical protein BDB00DRAFT_848017 [Zychaea mexicana]|uniref:uncharacterized protein n=1 Tax=Zychaea mexicana TaxID=64656 RepID=UPI0022FF2DC7|nr:uncharacterized protein BDB00DRAFT_848017 [Zychaea mexicana]KAI9488428.1 hypothetical protein BDB00DRAFT_848017 [Zychaea mexicana]
MSLAGYLFGNVDEQGRLDTDLDEELRESLQHVDSGVISKIFNTDTFGLEHGSVERGEEEEEEDDDEDLNDNELAERRKRQQQQQQEHASDAVDYSDFNEAVPDDQIFSEKYYKRGMGIVQTKAQQPKSRLRFVTDDYDDEEEEAQIVKTEQDEQQQTSKPLIIPPSALAQFPFSSSTSVQKQQQQLRTIPELPAQPQQQPARQVDIKELFPAFEQGKVLKFSDLFMTKLNQRSKLLPSKRVIFGDGYEYEVERDERMLFARPKKVERVRWDHGKAPAKRRKLDITPTDDYPVSESESEGEEDVSDEDVETPYVTETPAIDVENNRLYHSVMLDMWEDRIQWGGDSDGETAKGSSHEEVPLIGEIEQSVVSKHLNQQLEDGDWLDAVIWSNEKPNPAFLKIDLDLNDSNMLFDCEEVEATKAQMVEAKQVKKGRKPLPKPLPKIPIIYSTDEPHNKLPLNRFNLSNDKFYDSHYTGRLVRVRQTFGQLVVQHALPALKLHPALYKTRLSKAELRSFHRPLLQLPSNSDIQFSRVKVSKKKKKDKKKGYVDAMRSTKDLSLKDNAPFVLLEFSEEHPPIISNAGMGTLIINYYRKTEPKDETVPTGDIGEPFVLDIGDTSPFMNFGNVEPGQTISVLYNNLIRAPLFRHDVKSTDFLFVKSTYKGNTKYYIREIPAIFTVGQTYPVQEVPGPHSRKVTTTIKNRLQVVAYRLIRKNPLQRLRMNKLAQKFPEYTDIQIRQRLKEFLEFHRRNKEGGGGYWKTRGGGEPPNEEDLRKMVTPEMVSLYESMLVGERHLQDLGYGDVNDDEETGEGDSKLEVEQQLAPWFATRNFINATQGKAMLKLYGAGDPTGRGEGFSFIRVSMKDIFLRAGESAEEKLAQIEQRPKSAHRYNVAEQQQIYREEIARIWKAQLESLASKTEPELSDHDGEGESEADEISREVYHADSPMGMGSPAAHYGGRGYGGRFERAHSETVDDDEVSVTGSLSSRTSYHVNNPNKHLIIRRLMRQKNGESSWVQEVIRDPVVIKSYLRQRQMIEEEATSTEALEPTDDVEKNARMKKRIQDQLAKLKRNAERRRQRQLAKQAALAENPVLGLIRGKREGAMRRCGNCGRLGHMKTNKNCPMFHIVNNMNNAAAAAAAAAAAGGTPGTPTATPTTPSSSQQQPTTPSNNPAEPSLSTTPGGAATPSANPATPSSPPVK